MEYFISRGINYECKIEKYDDIIEPEEYFSMFEYFANKTSKKEYWMNRLKKFKETLNGGKVCENDVMNIWCET